jgi:hypothetical protein
VPAVELPRQSPLVVLQDFQSLGLLGIAPPPLSFRQLDPYLGEHQLLQVLEVFAGIINANLYLY